jgi:hypothetical protein
LVVGHFGTLFEGILAVLGNEVKNYAFGGSRYVLPSNCRAFGDKRYATGFGKFGLGEGKKVEKLES